MCNCFLHLLLNLYSSTHHRLDQMTLHRKTQSRTLNINLIRNYVYYLGHVNHQCDDNDDDDNTNMSRS